MSFKRDGGDDLNSDINVTPMVDVMLVLLIIFMVTAPVLSSQVDVTLPQAEVKRDKDDVDGKLVLEINLARQLTLGEIDKTPILWTELQAKLAGNPNAQRGLWVAADANLPYSVVVTAMAIAKNAGIPAVQLLTDPNEVIDTKLLDAPR